MAKEPNSFESVLTAINASKKLKALVPSLSEDNRRWNYEDLLGRELAKVRGLASLPERHGVDNFNRLYGDLPGSASEHAKKLLGLSARLKDDSISRFSGDLLGKESETVRKLRKVTESLTDRNSGRLYGDLPGSMSAQAKKTLDLSERLRDDRLSRLYEDLPGSVSAQAKKMLGLPERQKDDGLSRLYRGLLDNASAQAKKTLCLPERLRDDSLSRLYRDLPGTESETARKLRKVTESLRDRGSGQLYGNLHGSASVSAQARKMLALTERPGYRSSSRHYGNLQGFEPALEALRSISKKLSTGSFDTESANVRKLLDLPELLRGERAIRLYEGPFGNETAKARNLLGLTERLAETSVNNSSTNLTAKQAEQVTSELARLTAAVEISNEQNSRKNQQIFSAVNDEQVQPQRGVSRRQKASQKILQNNASTIAQLLEAISELQKRLDETEARRISTDKKVEENLSVVALGQEKIIQKTSQILSYVEWDIVDQSSQRLTPASQMKLSEIFWGIVINMLWDVIKKICGFN